MIQQFLGFFDSNPSSLEFDLFLFKRGRGGEEEDSFPPPPSESITLVATGINDDLKGSSLKEAFELYKALLYRYSCA